MWTLTRSAGRGSRHQDHRVSVPDGRGGIWFHVDTRDLYAVRARAAFLVAAAPELAAWEDVAKRDLGWVLLACEDLADQVVPAAQAPVEELPRMMDGEKTQARALLRDQQLV